MPVMNTETKLKETLHISRYWHSPEIRVAIHRDGIEIELTLEAFCTALAQEIGSPMMMFKAATLQKSLLDSAEAVLSKVKESSAHV